MGGNNALMIEDIHPKIINHIIMSSFISAGQRCSCARRIIINKKHANIIEKIIKRTKALKLNTFPNEQLPFMGPVVLEDVKNKILNQSFLNSTTLLKSDYLGKGNLITPRIELSSNTYKEEIFGPIIFIYLSNSFEESLHIANQGDYGLTASIYTKSKKNYNYAIQTIKTGVINWNNPTTGASSMAPFGGVKNSGNHRPGGFNMIDHCIVPISSTQSKRVIEINCPGL